MRIAQPHIASCVPHTHTDSQQLMQGCTHAAAKSTCFPDERSLRLEAACARLCSSRPALPLLLLLSSCCGDTNLNLHSLLCFTTFIRAFRCTHEGKRVAGSKDSFGCRDPTVDARRTCMLGGSRWSAGAGGEARGSGSMAGKGVTSSRRKGGLVDRSETSVRQKEGAAAAVQPLSVKSSLDEGTEIEEQLLCDR